MIFGNLSHYILQKNVWHFFMLPLNIGIFCCEISIALSHNTIQLALPLQRCQSQQAVSDCEASLAAVILYAPLKNPEKVQRLINCLLEEFFSQSLHFQSAPFWNVYQIMAKKICLFLESYYFNIMWLLHCIIQNQFEVCGSCHQLDPE